MLRVFVFLGQSVWKGLQDFRAQVSERFFVAVLGFRFLRL